MSPLPRQMAYNSQRITQIAPHIPIPRLLRDPPQLPLQSKVQLPSVDLEVLPLVDDKVLPDGLEEEGPAEVVAQEYPQLVVDPVGGEAVGGGDAGDA